MSLKNSVEGEQQLNDVAEEVRTSRSVWHASRAREWIERGEHERAIRDYEQSLLIPNDPFAMLAQSLPRVRRP